MNPSLGDAKVDKLLSNFSQKYVNKSLIHEMILPPMKVKEKTGKYAKYGTENLRIYADQILRAPGTRAMNADYSVSQGSYTCQERSLEKLIPDEMLNNTDDPYDPRRDAVATIMDNIGLNQEYTLATAMANISVLTNNETLSGTDQWNDDTSDPLTKIDNWIDAMRLATATVPNTIVMSHKVMLTLKRHPLVREALKYTGAMGNVGTPAFIQFLKDRFSVDNVYIGTAVYDSADAGQTASIGDVWGKHFWLLYNNPRPTLMQATFGYTFYDVMNIVEKYREEPKVSDVARVRRSFDQNIMDANLAYFGRNVIA